MDTLGFVVIWLACVVRAAICQVQHPMSHVSGGSLMPEYSDVNSCLDACKRNINCRAVDFDFVDSSCWFHYDNTVCNRIRSKPNCTHYKYVSCDRNKHVVGGRLQTGIIDVTSCINACVDTCLAVDFNSADSSCWFHTLTTACRELHAKLNCSHYSRVDCQTLLLPAPSTASPLFESFPGLHALGGELQAGINSASICIQSCHDDSGCKAVDFDFADDICFFHYERSACTALMDRPSATHYRLMSCAQPVATQEFPGLHIKDGRHVSGFSDVTSCVYACSLDLLCRAIDFNAKDNSCWFHEASTACRQPVPKFGCTHHKLFSCDLDAEPFQFAQALSGSIPNPAPIAMPDAMSGPMPDAMSGPMPDAMSGPMPDAMSDPMPNPMSDPMSDDAMPDAIPSDTEARSCGEPVISPQTKIVGGREAIPNSWPWQVTLLRGTLTTGVNLVCGGTLISSQYIVTAAHCLGNNTNPRKWLVTLGDHDLTVVESSQVTSEVLTIMVHARYNRLTLDNDIALIKLARPVTYTAEVSPVCMPSADMEPTEGMMCVVTGWGETRATPNALQTRLNQASVLITEHTSCNVSYSGAITNNMICAGLPEGGRDSCSGDSGGPLVCQFSGQKWYLIGVVSFGNDCALPNFPGVYTRVSNYASWINVNMV